MQVKDYPFIPKMRTERNFPARVLVSKLEYICYRFTSSFFVLPEYMIFLYMHYRIIRVLWGNVQAHSASRPAPDLISPDLA
jgi:hypothetical protein